MIELHADKIKAYGPKQDGSYTVTLDVGEYEQHQIAKIFMIPQQTVVKVTIEQKKDE